MSIAFTNLSYKVTVGKGKSAKDKIILNDLSGYVKAGSFVAIMGPSGEPTNEGIVGNGNSCCNLYPELIRNFLFPSMEIPLASCFPVSRLWKDQPSECAGGPSDQGRPDQPRGFRAGQWEAQGQELQTALSLCEYLAGEKLYTGKRDV